MRMKRDEKCIVPYCDVADESGAKPIYINVTIDGRRTWKKVGALCEVHLPDLDTGDSTSSMMHWIMYTPADDVNFIDTLRKGSLPFLRQCLERLEDELRRGFPHKSRIKKVAARIRALEKELLKKDAVKRADEERSERRLKPGDVMEAGEKVTVPHDFPGQGIVDQVLPQHRDFDSVRKRLKDAKRSPEDWREISELGKDVLPSAKTVYCDTCGCENVPITGKDGNIFCGACEALIEVVK